MAKKIKAPFDADPVFKNWMQFISTWYWLPAKGQIKTYGTLSSRTTLLHTYLMSNFEYTVRMKRKVATYNPNFILIYGYPTPMAADGSFYDGLYFQYANDGSYYVYQRVDGVNYQLVGWTESDAIVPYGWNELKVLGNLPYVDLWINGTYLGWVELNGGAGNVGFGMLTTVADSPLLVDWAYANAYYVTVQREHDPAMQLGSNPLPVTDEEFNNAH